MKKKGGKSKNGWDELRHAKLWKLGQYRIYKIVRDRKLKRPKTKDKDKWDHLYDEKCK